MIDNLFSSLFYSPYIKNYQTDNSSLVLEVYCKNKRCGYINFTNERLISIISFGIRSFKGNAKREAVYLHYNDQKLFIVNKATSKTIFKIKCSEEVFRSIKAKLNTLKYTFLDKRNNH